MGYWGTSVLKCPQLKFFFEINRNLGVIRGYFFQPKAIGQILWFSSTREDGVIPTGKIHSVFSLVGTIYSG